MESIEVEILNWSAHNVRSTIKHPRWFALSNRILENPKMFGFSDAEFKAWIYVLCQASQANSSVVEIVFAHASRVCGITARTLSSTIEKLRKAECIQLRDHGVHTCVPIMITTEQNRTEQTEQNITKQNTPKSFDFAEIYFLFPRKEGKQRGIEICEKTIKTSDDFEALRSSVTRYRDHLARNGTETRFIKQFSTFMGSWRDWLDPETGSDAKTSKPSKWDILKQREQEKA